MLGAKAIYELGFDWFNRLLDFKNSLVSALRTTKDVDRRNSE
jgi:hypothetical protein